MPIPSFKQIHIKNELRKSIYQQLGMHQFGQVPYILSLGHLENELEALKNIEDYIKEKKISHFPYPIYVITNIKNYRGDLAVFNSFENCPAFFKQKIKQLNIKENKILQKIYLKQKNLYNMREIEFKPYLKEYANSHKRLFKLYKEEIYLKDLIQKLEKHYDKKE